MEIIRVTLTEIDGLQKIGRQTFHETFASANTEENMSKYLDEGFSIGKLTAELNDKNAEFYFAYLNNTVAGYLKINTGQSQTELKGEKSVEIERIYVLKEFQGRNVGQSLYHKALSIARREKAQYVWLGVWEQNQKAINFYRKNGFVEFDKHIFRLGDDNQTDIMMKLTLTSRE